MKPPPLKYMALLSKAEYVSLNDVLNESNDLSLKYKIIWNNNNSPI